MADVDDEPLALALRVELAGEVADVVAGHRAQVQVADLAVAGGVDDAGATVAPVVDAQLAFTAQVDRRDDDGAFLAGGLAHLQQHLLAGLAAHQFAGIGGLGRVAAVDLRDHAAHRDVQPRRGQRAGVGRQFRIAAEDAGDLPALGVALELCAQPGETGFLGALAQLARRDLAVQQAQLAHHLRHDLGQLAALGDAFHQRRVLGAHRGPVHAVHVLVVEEVALHAPGVIEHLAPFGLGIDGDLPVGPAHARLVQVAGDLRSGVDDQDLRRGARRRGAADQQLLAVGAQVEGADLFGEGLDLGFAGTDRQLAQRGALVQVQALGVHGQAAVVAGGDGHFEQAQRQAGDLDLGLALGRGLLFLHRGGLGLVDLLLRFLVVGLVLLLLADLGLLLGLQALEFIRLRERETQARLQRQRVDLPALVEERAHVAIAPGAGVAGHVEAAARQEVEPLAIGAEGRRGRGVAVAAELVDLAVGDGQQHQLLAIGVAGGADEGQRLAVGGPGQRGRAVAERVVVDLAGRGGAAGVLEVGEEEAAFLVGVGDPAAVGRGRQAAAHRGGAFGDLPRLAGAVGGQAPDLEFAAVVAQREDVAAVAAEGGVAATAGVAEASGHRQFGAAQRADALRGQAAARGQHDLLAIGRQ